jgi:DNA-binding MarR family transcriptional regulator
MTEPADRAAAIARVQDGLTTISRRGAARARRGYASLSLVDQSLVTYIGSNPGCRNVDIAAHFLLNKSTVSRQVAALIDLGLVEVNDAGGDVRGNGLRLTDAGSTLSRTIADEVLASLTERLASWTEEDLKSFAGLIERFNAGDWNVH